MRKALLLLSLAFPFISLCQGPTYTDTVDLVDFLESVYNEESTYQEEDRYTLRQVVIRSQFELLDEGEIRVSGNLPPGQGFDLANGETTHVSKRLKKRLGEDSVVFNQEILIQRCILVPAVLSTTSRSIRIENALEIEGIDFEHLSLVEINTLTGISGMPDGPVSLEFRDCKIGSKPRNL